MLAKTEELQIKAKSTNAAIIGINASKLYKSVLEPEIRINDCKIFRCDRNIHGGSVAHYIRKHLTFSVIVVSPREIESVFEIFLPNSKLIAV